MNKCKKCKGAGMINYQPILANGKLCKPCHGRGYLLPKREYKSISVSKTTTPTSILIGNL